MTPSIATPDGPARLDSDDDRDEPEREIDEWLALEFGLSFDPFRQLDAAQDNHLHEYMIDHEMFDVLHSTAHTFLFAPAGGGKSAFRVRLARACRVGESGRRLFPVIYLLPPAVITASPHELWRAHEEAMLRALAFELLLWLAYHPNELSRLTSDYQQSLRALLERWLPTSLDELLNQITDIEALTKISRGYDPTARLPNPPDKAMLQRFRAVLSELRPAENQRDNVGTWDDCVKVVRQALQFDAIYLLIDGVDAFPETFNQPSRAWELLQPILAQRNHWTNERVFVKAFLPSEMAESSPLTKDVTRGTINWTPDALKLLLQRRLEAVSGITPAGLSLLADLELFNIEDRVVKAIRPYPREALRFVERMFLEHVRDKGPKGRLSIADFQGASAWYRQSSPTS